MNQPTLPGLDGGKRFADFCEFHKANPQVFTLFRQFAESALLSGNRRRFGARMIGERIRWYTAVETTDQEFKINDHHWPYYARLLMLSDPRFEGFFERRDAQFDVDDETIRSELL